MRTRVLTLLALFSLLALVAAGCVPIQPESAALAPTPTPLPAARGRIAHLVADAPMLQTFANGNAIGNPVAPGDLTGYLAVDPGTYTLRFAPDGKGVEAAIAADLTVAAEPGHDYTIALLGTIANGDVTAVLIDDTAALSRIDPTRETVVTFVNNVKGAPPLSVAFSGKTVIESAAYGAAGQGVVPLGANDGTLIADVNNSDNVLFAAPFFPAFDAHVSWFLGTYGKYPGENRKDYFLAPIPTFDGEPTITAGGPIEIGMPATGELALGERMQFALTLASDTTLDITAASTPDSALDAVVGVYAADSTLVAENDEISDEDETTNAGLAGLQLTAGAYTVEVSSYRDASAGGFTLSIDATK